MKAYSKEFYDAITMFEQVAKVLRLGIRFDKPTQDQLQRIPVGYGWYNDGRANELFNIFLNGIEYGIYVAQQTNEVKNEN